MEFDKVEDLDEYEPVEKKTKKKKFQRPSILKKEMDISESRTVNSDSSFDIP